MGSGDYDVKEWFQNQTSLPEYSKKQNMNGQASIKKSAKDHSLFILALLEKEGTTMFDQKACQYYF